jgi:hypothetical protein
MNKIEQLAALKKQTEALQASLVSDCNPISIQELADANGWTYLLAQALVKVLVSKGVVIEVGNRPNTAGKTGKPPKLYAIPAKLELELALPTLKTEVV